MLCRSMAYEILSQCPHQANHLTTISVNQEDLTDSLKSQHGFASTWLRWDVVRDRAMRACWPPPTPSSLILHQEGDERRSIDSTATSHIINKEHSSCPDIAIWPATTHKLKVKSGLIWLPGLTCCSGHSVHNTKEGIWFFCDIWHEITEQLTHKDRKRHDYFTSSCHKRILI